MGNVEADVVEFDENLELDVPIYLNELLYDVSDTLTASYMDFSDAVAHLKGLILSAKASEKTNTPFMNEVAGNDDWGYGRCCDSFYDILNTTEIDGGISNIVDYLDEFSGTYYGHIYEYSAYATYLEYYVALVEQTLKDSLSEDEDAYNTLIGEIKGDSSITSLDSLVSSPLIARRFGAVMGAKVGGAFRVPGQTAFMDFLSGSISFKELFSKKKTFEIFEEAADNFVNGNSTFSNKKVGARIKGCVKAGFGTFLFLEGIDLINGELSWKNTAINAGRGVVTAVAGYAGNAITASLTTSSVGAMAGPIGLAVTLAVSLVGNLLVDWIAELVDPTVDRTIESGIPSSYEETTYESVRDKILSSGYISGTPKIYPNESAYDTISNLCSRGADHRVINYFSTLASGDYTEGTSVETYKTYDGIVKLYREEANRIAAIRDNCEYRDGMQTGVLGTTFKEEPGYYYNDGNGEAYYMGDGILNRDDFIARVRNEVPANIDEDAISFADSLIDLFNNKDNDSWLQGFYDDFCNYDILAEVEEGYVNDGDMHSYRIVKDPAMYRYFGEGSN